MVLKIQKKNLIIYKFKTNLRCCSAFERILKAKSTSNGQFIATDRCGKQQETFNQLLIVIFISPDTCKLEKQNKMEK